MVPFCTDASKSPFSSLASPPLRERVFCLAYVRDVSSTTAYYFFFSQSTSFISRYSMCMSVHFDVVKVLFERTVSCPMSEQTRCKLNLCTVDISVTPGSAVQIAAELYKCMVGHITTYLLTPQ